MSDDASPPQVATAPAESVQASLVEHSADVERLARTPVTLGIVMFLLLTLGGYFVFDIVAKLNEIDSELKELNGILTDQGKDIVRLQVQVELAVTKDADEGHGSARSGTTRSREPRKKHRKEKNQ